MKYKVIILILLYVFELQAVCLKDNLGNVVCSKYAGGGAVLNNFGTVICGKGKCLTNNIGVSVCSKIQGGGAAMNNLGIIKCLGGCENANRSMCTFGEL